jgi:hypothetical protein
MPLKKPKTPLDELPDAAGSAVMLACFKACCGSSAGRGGAGAFSGPVKTPVKKPETPLGELPDAAGSAAVLACAEAPDDPAGFRPIETMTRSLPSEADFRSAGRSDSIQSAFV